MASIRDLILQITEKKSGNALTEAANDLDHLSRGVDASGDSMKKMETDTKRLNAEIEKSTARIKELHKQVAATGDTHLFGDIRKEESRLRGFEKTLKAIKADLTDPGGGGGGLFSNFTKGVAEGFEGGLTSPASITAIAAGLVVLAVPLGAAVAGAVVGVAGVGGIVGGIFAASKDPSVRAAAGTFGHNISEMFFGSGSSFVEPIKKSLIFLEGAFKDLHLGNTFALAAPLLEPLTHGLADLVHNLLPGLNAALARGGPFVDALGKGLGYLGSSLSEFLDDASASHGAIEGLQALFIVLGGTIKFIGLELEGASRAFHFFNVIAGGTYDILDKTLNTLGLHSDKVHRVSEAVRGMTGDTEQAGSATLEYTGAISGLVGPLARAANASKDFNDATKEGIALASKVIGDSLSVDEALIAEAQGFNDLADAIRNNGTAWDGNSKQALANRSAFDQQLRKIQEVRQAEIDAGESVDAANAEYEQGVKTLLGYAQQAGATRQELEALAKKYIIQFEIASNLAAIGNAIGADFAGFNGIGGGLASGGNAVAGTTYLTGEDGPEWVTFGKNARVWPNGTFPDERPRYGSPSVPSGGGTTTTVIAFASTGNAVLDMLLAILRPYVQSQGGNVQNALMG